MAQVPHYIPGMPSPKATLAVVRRVCELLTTQVADVGPREGRRDLRAPGG